MKSVSAKVWIFLLCACLICATAVSRYRAARIRVGAVNAAVLDEDRRAVSEAIHEYSMDVGKSPQTLQDLVDAGYLKSIPHAPGLRLPLPETRGN
jgi:general secretion pathway protein G